ncbi:MAG: MazG nucleotide pyrophosphohydrolase domain-containing protein [Candidatus Methanomethylicia archaeon]
MRIEDLQNLMKNLYYNRDKARGVDKTFMWYIEELGELVKAIRSNNKVSIEEELADSMAWLLSIANLFDIKLGEVITAKYNGVCPKCKNIPCKCIV